MSGTLSGLFAGAVAAWLGPQWRGHLLGYPVTYHGVLMIISGVIRGLALLWLIGLADERAYSPRAALRYMADNMYSNLEQAIFAPGRRLLKFGHRSLRAVGRFMEP